jgi:hypothetical protein
MLEYLNAEVDKIYTWSWPNTMQWHLHKVKKRMKNLPTTQITLEHDCFRNQHQHGILISHFSTQYTCKFVGGNYQHPPKGVGGTHNQRQNGYPVLRRPQKQAM